jgi:hypothetical protein
MDNAHIERWFRTLKQKYIYLIPQTMDTHCIVASPSS